MSDDSGPRAGSSSGMDVLDLEPTTTALAALVRATTDEQLARPTPCPAWTVADLCDHLGGLALAFTRAARREPLPGDGAPDVDGSRLEPGWRDRVAAALDDLAVAWSDPAAYEGDAQAGPVVMPAPAAATVALDEVLLHGWDLAVATGRGYDPDPAAVAVCTGFVESFAPPPGSPADDGGLFGPPVAVADEATPFERLLAMAGRDPAWRPRDASA